MADKSESTHVESYQPKTHDHESQLQDRPVYEEMRDPQLEATAHQVEYSEQEEKAIVRKLDRRVISTLFVLYMMSFLDRSNIGNANTAGLSKDLGMSPEQYEWLLTIFYIAYVVGQPATLLWKVVPPHIYMCICTTLWGGFALCQASATGWSGMMALRWFLGLAETSFGPGVPYYLSFLYKQRELGLRQGMFLSAAPIATAYAGALAYAITHIKGSIADWRILFLIEGSPAVIAIPFVWYLIPAKVETARFLTEREKKITQARAARQGDQGQNEGLKLRQVGLALIDYKAWFTALMYFSANVSFSSLPVFLPTILTGMGFTSVRAQGLTAPAYLASFFVLIAVVYFGDRKLDRTIFMIPLGIIAFVGYLILALVKSNGVRYFAVYLCTCGVFPVIALTLPLISSLHVTQSKRGGAFMLTNLVGQCGPLLGTRLFPKHEGPYYVKGFSICCAFMLFHVILTSTLRLILTLENRRKDRLHGKVTKEEAFDFTKEGEEHPGFRYIM